MIRNPRHIRLSICVNARIYTRNETSTGDSHLQLFSILRASARGPQVLFPSPAADPWTQRRRYRPSSESTVLSTPATPPLPSARPFPPGREDQRFVYPALSQFGLAKVKEMLKDIVNSCYDSAVEKQKAEGYIVLERGLVMIPLPFQGCE